MRPVKTSSFRRPAALAAVVLAVAGSAAGMWWKTRPAPRPLVDTARLGPGLYGLHYDFTMDVPSAKGGPVHLGTLLDGKLELAQGKEDWVAARLSGAELHLDGAARKLTDFQATGGERELSKPWLMKVDSDGRVRDTRFSAGISTASRAVLTAIASGTQYVHAPQPAMNEWTATENNINGSYETHYSVTPEGAVEKRAEDRADGKNPTNSTTRYQFDGPLLASASFEQRGDTVANGKDQDRQTRFVQHVRIERLGSSDNAWASALDPQELQPFDTSAAGAKPPAEPTARPLDDLLPLVNKVPEKELPAEHATLRDELTKAVATQPGAAARVATLLREGTEPEPARRTIMEALAGAATAEAQHEIARLITGKALPREQQVRMLDAAAFVHRPNRELADSLSNIAFNPSDVTYAGNAAMVLGAIAARMPAGSGATIVQTMVSTATTIESSPKAPAGLRIAWLEALGNTGDPTALPTILQSLATDPSELVRVAAAHALRFQSSQGSLEAMDKALLHDPSMLVRRELVKAALNMGPTVMLPLVQRTLLSDKIDYVRMGAAYTITVWMSNAPGLKSILQQAYQTEKSIKVRDSLMNYMNPGRVAPPTVMTPLTQSQQTQGQQPQGQP